MVLYLDMPAAVSQVLMTKRYHGDESKKDIHESHVAFLEQCRETALYAADRQGWKRIPCAAADAPRSVDEIARDVLTAVGEVLQFADI